MNLNTWKLKNTQTGEIIPVAKAAFKVGRNANADLVSETSLLSRNHATLTILIDGLYVLDHKSLNGTFVNDKKIDPLEMIKLEKGDILGFGCSHQSIAKYAITSPFLFEILQEDIVNQESPKANGNTFCQINDNECVIISDDEDNDLIASSQIFHITETIKKEPSSFTDGFDPYTEIKEELRFLDDCVKEIEVDLTEDDEVCHNTMELLDVLGSSIEEDSPKQQQEIVTVNPCDQKNTGKGLELSVVIPKENIFKKNHSIVEVSDDEIEIIKTQSKLKRLSNLTKNKIPPIIEPHTIKINTPEKGKNTGKRKTSKVTSPAKKLKTSKTPPPLNRNDKEALSEERKQKLKKLTRKSTSDIDTLKSVRVQPKVKVSDSRGNFLLDQINRPLVSSRKSHTPEKPKSNQQKVKETHVKTNCSPIEINRNVNVPSTSYNASGLITISANKGEGLQKTDLNNFLIPQFSAPKRLSKDYENVDSEIHRIVQWPVQWLVEQSKTDISPPVSGEMLPRLVPDIFESYCDYVNIMMPLLFLELWQFIYQSACNNEEAREPVMVTMVHERRMDKVVYLDCECFLEENNPKTAIRPEDLVIIEVRLRDAKNCYKFVSFGIVKSFGKLNRQGGLNSDSNCRFTIVIRHLQGKEIFDKTLLIKVITSISSSLKLLRTMKCLENSVICKNILDPTFNKLDISSKGTTISGMIVNEEQKRITIEGSNFCLGNEPGIYLITGPPGTGKSTVIVNILFEILFKSQKYGKNPLILLTAPSNAAIDCLITKLAECRTKLLDSQRRCLKLIRIGPEASISKNVEKFKLSYFAQKDVLVQCRLQHSPEFREWTESGRDDLDVFLKKHLKHEYYYRLRNAEEKILLGSNVICTTLNSCVGFRLRQSIRKGQLKFSCCVIDEATQCTELESLLPLQLGIDKFVIVGDPQQLPAVVCNKEAQNKGFGNSLFWRIDNCLKNRGCPQTRMLYNQYRMKPEICEYPNKKFYEGKLRSVPVCSNVIKPSIKPYLLFNLKSNYEDTSEYVNKDEVAFINILLQNLLSSVKTTRYTIGIITPYKAQKMLLRESISKIRQNKEVIISVNTVDSFQGMENDIIIISCVRYNPNSFLQNEQRLNVALTRAKQALYVIGNYTLFKQSRPLYDLREDAKKRKLCFDINIKNIRSLHKFIF